MSMLIIILFIDKYEHLHPLQTVTFIGWHLNFIYKLETKKIYDKCKSLVNQKHLKPIQPSVNIIGSYLMNMFTKTIITVSIDCHVIYVFSHDIKIDNFFPSKYLFFEHR